MQILVEKYSKLARAFVNLHANEYNFHNDEAHTCIIA